MKISPKLILLGLAAVASIWILAACRTFSPINVDNALPLDSTPTKKPASTGTVEKPTRTPMPTYTPRPSRTPKPSPTLPNGSDFACLPANGDRVSGVVAGVVDGDTITVQIGVQKFTVRYIGIDTPETNVQPPERMGPEATARNRELVSGKRVTLISDPEVGNTDRYDRLLRFIVVDEVFVNATLVREGLARYYASPNACGKLFFALENEARSAKAGLWAPRP